MAVFLLIGKTSALTMNIAGVVKDWLLIGLSYVMYRWVGHASIGLGCRVPHHGSSTTPLRGRLGRVTSV